MKAQSTGEVQALLAAERAAQPFLAFRDDAGTLVIETLGPDKRLLTVGREPSCDLALPWDGRVSRTHAVFERSAGLVDPPVRPDGRLGAAHRLAVVRGTGSFTQLRRRSHGPI